MGNFDPRRLTHLRPWPTGLFKHFRPIFSGTAASWTWDSDTIPTLDADLTQTLDEEST